MTGPHGEQLGRRWRPVQRAGLYVPGGRASYPSTVLMNAVPAKVAGVGEIIMVVPMPDGVVNPYVLTAAHVAGVDRIFKLGGAQAVAALAYGTETVPKVDKITGPGNIFVATAKRLVFGTVDIDMIAGPSEILVINDGSGNPAHIAADLLSQAEHDELAAALLITTDETFARQVAAELESQLQELSRAVIARQSIDNFGAIILARDLDEAAAFSNKIAPEHLELAVDEPGQGEADDHLQDDGPDQEMRGGGHVRPDVFVGQNPRVVANADPLHLGIGFVRGIVGER